MLTTRRILLLFTLSFTLLFAGPVLSPDSVPLDIHDPGLGVPMMAIPGSVWEVWFNDNWKNDHPGYHGDFDFNDLVLEISFGPFATGWARFLGSTSADFNVGWVNTAFLWEFNGSPQAFAYTPGTEVIVRMDDWTTGHHYFSGLAEANPDGVVHAWTERTDSPAPVPEPGNSLLVLIGGVLLGARRVARA